MHSSVQSRGKSRLKSILDNYNIILVTLLMIVVATLFEGTTFLSVSNFINIVRSNAVVGIIAFGMSFVIISGNIDLSVGAQMVSVAAITLWVTNATQSAVLGVITALITGTAFSFITGLIVTKGRVPSFIVTLGMQYIYRSILVYSLNGGGTTTKVAAYQAISNYNLFGWLPMSIVYFFLAMIACWYIANFTKLGRHIYAVGSNEKATRLSGIKTDRIKIMSFVLLGALIGIAAVVESSRMGSINSTSSGTSYELNAIAMAVIGGVAMEGGKGKITNTMFGAFIFGIINNILTLIGINTRLVNAVKGAIIILAVLLQRKDTEK
ncbi:MAG: ABC transporter permease [Clostridia bacterium]|nr:ABC transporter permease [Clostridia bacterium]